MGCFKKENSYLLDGNYTASFSEPNTYKEINNTIVNDNIKTLYLLYYFDYLRGKKTDKTAVKAEIIYIRENIKNIITTLKRANPNLEIKVINVNAYESSAEFRISSILYKKLEMDKTNIASVLKKLETYKYISQRFKTIPKEIEVIDNDIKRLSKEKVVCNRKVTLDNIKYLKLIKNARISSAGGSLILQINKLPINPSEPLGKVYNIESFRENPYLYKTAKYIYSGCHFGMVETEIEIDYSFNLHFIKTLDNTFDTMFSKNNWSTVGYPHFGVNHFCAGEFNDTMAHAAEYGMDYYLISLKQYLTTANMRDLAGARIWWYPVYDANDKLVYCAGLDAFIDCDLESAFGSEIYKAVKEEPDWEKKLSLLKQRGIDINPNLAKKLYGSMNTGYYYKGKEDAFGLVCKELDPELYEELRKDGRL